LGATQFLYWPELEFRTETPLRLRYRRNGLANRSSIGGLRNIQCLLDQDSAPGELEFHDPRQQRDAGDISFMAIVPLGAKAKDGWRTQGNGLPQALLRSRILLPHARASGDKLIYQQV